MTRAWVDRFGKATAMRSCAIAVLLAGGAVAAWGQAGLSVRAVSPRAGLLFTDSEPVDVRVAVAGAAGSVTVEYQVVESDGPDPRFVSTRKVRNTRSQTAS